MNDIRNIQRKPGIAVFMAAYLHTVHPDRAVFIHAVKLQLVHMSFGNGRNHKLFPVPANPPSVPEALGLPLLHFPVNRGKNGPIMRQLDRREILVLRLQQGKFPILHNGGFIPAHLIIPSPRKYLAS
ncbi:hypothetical protein D3C75_784630 [compost metagenome]